MKCCKFLIINQLDVMLVLLPRVADALVGRRLLLAVWATGAFVLPVSHSLKECLLLCLVMQYGGL